MRSTMWRTVIGYLLLAAVAAFILQALLRLKFPLVERLQAKTLYSSNRGRDLRAPRLSMAACFMVALLASLSR